MTNDEGLVGANGNSPLVITPPLVRAYGLYLYNFQN